MTSISMTFFIEIQCDVLGINAAILEYALSLIGIDLVRKILNCKRDKFEL